jgi:hypothetical protein
LPRVPDKKINMRNSFFLPLALLAAAPLAAQIKVQTLQPTRLSIFKNGTYFVKREATVTVEGQSFYTPAPQNVLLGTYWLMVGREAGLQSVALKKDTLKIQEPARSMIQYLTANIGKDIALLRHTNGAEPAKVSGKLLAFDGDAIVLRLSDGKTWVGDVDDFNELLLGNNSNEEYKGLQVSDVAKVTLQKPVNSTTAATLSLEKGVQWFPSYLLRILNDKEARLEMKATIVNGSNSFANTAVDIIIGNPELFFGQQLDPACSNYLNGTLLSGRSANMQLMTNYNQVAGGVNDRYEGDSEESGELPDNSKDGEKMEDLYYYQLGNLTLEPYSRMIVPVLSATVGYEDVYTADLGINSPELGRSKPLEVFHGYRIANGTNAPFTTGSVWVLNQKEQPLAQAQLKYTPIKGSTEITLSKALDVTIKNEEQETKREANARALGYGNNYDRVTYSGKLQFANLQPKTIKLRIKKQLSGNLLKTSLPGNAQKLKDDDSINSITQLEWEIVLEPGAKKEISYEYQTYKAAR